MSPTIDPLRSLDGSAPDATTLPRRLRWIWPFFDLWMICGLRWRGCERS